MRTRHHIAWPAKDYQSKVERKYRSLPCNIVLLDERVHQTLHFLSEPPRKPTPTQMREQIDRHNHKECGCERK